MFFFAFLRSWLKFLNKAESDKIACLIAFPTAMIYSPRTNSHEQNPKQFTVSGNTLNFVVHFKN